MSSEDPCSDELSAAVAAFAQRGTVETRLDGPLRVAGRGGRRRRTGRDGPAHGQANSRRSEDRPTVEFRVFGAVVGRTRFTVVTVGCGITCHQVHLGESPPSRRFSLSGRDCNNYLRRGLVADRAVEENC
jgi:hypothetical protein